MKQRYFIHLAYDGTHYHGWQIQPNGSSVQETLMHALYTFLRQKIDVVGAGRTDAGVHASCMVAHFDYDGIFNVQQAVHKMNCILPNDIVVYSIQLVSPDAHARFDATYRTYYYHVVMQKNPFRRNYAYRLQGNYDFNQMNEAAKSLFNYIDFTSFSKLHTDVKTNNCRIMRAEWIQQSPHEWTFVVQADRFLRNMVRAIVGTLLEVGRGKITIDDFCHIIEDKNRNNAGASVPGHALFLADIGYPEEIYKP